MKRKDMKNLVSRNKFLIHHSKLQIGRGFKSEKGATLKVSFFQNKPY